RSRHRSNRASPHYMKTAPLPLPCLVKKPSCYVVSPRRNGVAANGCDHTFVRYSRRFGVLMIRTSTMRTNRIEHVVRQLPKYKIDQCSRIGVGGRHGVVPD